LEDLGKDGKIISILKKQTGRFDCIHLAQVTVQWRALVNTAMKLPVPKTQGIS